MITICDMYIPFELPVWFAVLLYIVIGLIFIGILLCVKKEKANPKLAKGIGFGLSLFLGLCVFIFLFPEIVRDILPSPAYGPTTRQYDVIQYKVLGKNLALKYPGSKALVIVSDYPFKYNRREKWLVDGLKEGFGDKITIGAIDYPKPKDLDGKTADEMYWVLNDIWKAEDFDALIDQHKDCNLIVSVIGLPVDVNQIKIWKKNEKERPKVAIGYNHFGYDKELIKDGRIVAVATYNPDAKYTTDPLPDKLEEAFDVRYILITPPNVDEVARKYPSLFETPDGLPKDIKIKSKTFKGKLRTDTYSYYLSDDGKEIKHGKFTRENHKFEITTEEGFFIHGKKSGLWILRAFPPEQESHWIYSNGSVMGIDQCKQYVNGKEIASYWTNKESEPDDGTIWRMKTSPGSIRGPVISICRIDTLKNGKVIKSQECDLYGNKLKEKETLSGKPLGKCLNKEDFDKLTHLNKKWAKEQKEAKALQKAEQGKP